MKYVLQGVRLTSARSSAYQMHQVSNSYSRQWM